MASGSRSGSQGGVKQADLRTMSGAVLRSAVAQTSTLLGSGELAGTAGPARPLAGRPASLRGQEAAQEASEDPSFLPAALSLG